MEGEITDQKVRDLISCWKKARGETLTYSKAKKRLEKAVADGCPLLDKCLNCPKHKECPLEKD